MLIQLYLLLILQILSCFATEAKPKLTFDEFFDYTTFPFLKFSPTGQHLLIQTRHPSWNASVYENTLWLYDIQNQTKKACQRSSFGAEMWNSRISFQFVILLHYL
ncbi:unnamed protein product [Rotaria sp. Silwood1]|nr:unnamed protein product [Rotaria sp. Silwood1]